MRRLFLALALCAAASGAHPATLPAFPGAMGGGTLTAAGRNGAILQVTNLNDTGAGSFRACMTASGARYCVCRVGGIVPIRSDITVTPFVRFDGQTCPGGGLILGDGHLVGRPLNITTHDVVVRYLTINVNNPAIPVGPDTGTTGIEIGTGAFNVVLDHLSLMYAGNKALISYTSDTSQAAIIHDDTVQNSVLILPNVGHPVGPMTDTIAFAYLSCHQDFHHNFFAWIGHRIALYNTSCGNWVNNLTWNWSDPAAAYGFGMEPQGPSLVDMIGNIWKKGNMNAGNTANPHPVNINATGSSDCSTNCWNGATQPSHYMHDNVCDQGSDWQCAAQVTSEGGPETGPVPPAWQRAVQQAPEPNPIIADPSAGLDTKILATVGNSRGLTCAGTWVMRRNAIDAMVISGYPTAQGALFNQQFPAPTAPAGTPCALDPVTLVPSAYLAARGLPAGMNPWAIAPGDVYPIVETYGNGGGSAPPAPPVVNCAPNPVAPGGSSACAGNQPINTWTASAGTISTSGALTAPTTPTTVMVTGSNANGSGNTPVQVTSSATPCFNTPNCPIGSTVAIIAGPANIRNTPSGVNNPIGTQPTGAKGVVQSGPTNPGSTFAWVLVQFNGAAGCALPTPTFSANCGYVGNDNLTPVSTPPPAPTVSCSPPSVQTGGTATCTANQPITTWNASIGSISAAGIFTAPAGAGNAQITGTNANGTSSPFPVTVTAVPPPPGTLNLSLSCPYTIVNNAAVVNTAACVVKQQ